MALSALLELDPASVPNAVKEGWPLIVGGTLRVFKDLPKAIEGEYTTPRRSVSWGVLDADVHDCLARQALEQYLKDESDEDDIIDDSLLNLNEEEEDVWDQDSAYLEMLANEGARLRAKSEKQANGEDVSDDESDDDEEIGEELGYISPLDNVDPYVTFKHALTSKDH